MDDTLSRMSNVELGKLFPIIIKEPNPIWKERFAEEQKLIEAAFPADYFLSIEHIGSTAVPNLAAKPTIDILCQIRDNTDIEEFIECFQVLGYRLLNRPENPPPHLMFIKGYSSQGFEEKVFHVHIRYVGDWDEFYFRDYLIKYPSVAVEYAILKRRLATVYEFDRDGYTEAKTDFIKNITERARKTEEAIKFRTPNL